LQRNVDRDAAQLAALEVQGWQALIIWECEIKKRAELAAKICTYLRCDAEASA
jgi:DNA mismatch endonuclease (patch repair protein)